MRGFYSDIVSIFYFNIIIILLSAGVFLPKKFSDLFHVYISIRAVYIVE